MFNVASFIIAEKRDFNPNTVESVIQIRTDFGNIILDKSTAIKFAKTLRTEINKIQD